MKHSDRSTKIVATIGPASRDPEVLSRMIDAGLNVVRMNFSHGDHEDHRQTVQMVRELAARKGVTIGILQDLQGPKIRVGRFAQGAVTLNAGDKFVITMDDVDGDESRVTSTYKSLAEDVQPGMALLLDDGNMALRVDHVRGADIHTTVVIGGVLKNNKGINVPDADLSVPAMSEKDVSDMEFGAQIGVDWVALSFVRSRDDLLLARHYLSRYGSRAKLMAKIEKPQAVERFADILKEVDGIMVARGDLGVEMRPEQVPTIQKHIIRMCREAGKPVITATQMLESMISLPRPTRAEASDVANAIYDGTDAVMLSAESAAGQYPVEAVAMMDRIAREAESSDHYLLLQRHLMVDTELAQDAIAHSACSIGENLEASVIVTFTSTGGAAARVAKNRPPLAILALTPNEQTRNQLALSWGVVPVLSEDPRDTDDMVRIANDELRKSGLADLGDRYVITAGVPFGVRGTTNMLRVERLR
ncbi:pyruvate kinase [Deinococcus deserti]|uniref:Pyruvate kinase n=1 Tax=Deinococcus deserti (strain DSM 17065 / CIP 109153 / LMG 22923 / VCD115) TaxID=546414 RepID=C1CXJ4_DEIDV|nr:pyruvate kinase [Deinococcus deserti]ACO44800.1 putative Pyruvate kinase [Deinococcus deserti VCD115]